MELDTIVYLGVGLMGAVGVLLCVLVGMLSYQVRSLKRDLKELQNSYPIRVQKLKLDQESEQNHAFHNATISPDEELSKRGFSMYMGADRDVESGRSTERQTGRQLLDELNKEIDQREQRQVTAPPFLLQGIQENKRRSRSLVSNVKNDHGRASETNPNFIY